MPKILMPSPWDGSQAEGKPVHPVLTDAKAADLKRFLERLFRSFQDVAARFWSRVQVVEDLESCWEWRYVYKTAKKERPQFRLNGDVWLSHRLAYRITYGKLPKRLKVCHHCDNPNCCNPNHFFIGTQADNMRDMIAKLRQARGESSGRAKLTAVAVRLIRSCLDAERELAVKFNVSRATIGDIRRRKSWRHI